MHCRQVSAVKGRGHSSMSFDESNIPTTVSSGDNIANNNNNKNSRLKNSNSTVSSLLPAPSHTRTASSPAQLLDVSSYTTASQAKRTDSLDVYPKPFSLDGGTNSNLDLPKRTTSDTSDKYTKRSSSNASDKSQRRVTDDNRCSSRTPSERSFILHTPDTVTATPELLAELLKGSSEKLSAERASAAVTLHNQSPPSFENNIPVQLLNHLVSNLNNFPSK